MKITVITVVRNGVEYIEDCITSVISQSHKDLEYIVIDGKSTDGTVEIITRYKDKISTIIIEEDKGHFDAMNKGLRLASGDAIGFLHADDMYANKDVIQDVVKVFQMNNVDSIYGNLVYVDKHNTDRIIRYWKSGEYNPKKMKLGWMPAHPTFFIKREIFRKFGLFDMNFEISADYELALRFIYKYNISSVFLPKVLVKMRLGGLSNRNIKNIAKKTVEDYKACQMHGLGIPALVMKNLSKLNQFFIR